MSQAIEEKSFNFHLESTYRFQSIPNVLKARLKDMKMSDVIAIFKLFT